MILYESGGYIYFALEKDDVNSFVYGNWYMLIKEIKGLNPKPEFDYENNVWIIHCSLRDKVSELIKKYFRDKNQRSLFEGEFDKDKD